MTIRIFETRKSWIWFDAYGEALDHKGQESLVSKLSLASSYADLFESALKSEGELSLPWPPGSGLYNHFWRRYLEGDPDKLSGNAAWRHLLPLRLAIPVVHTGVSPATSLHVETENLPCDRLTLEAFFQPHGIGLLGTVFLKGEMDLEETVERVRQCYDTAGLWLVGPDGRQGPFKLPLLAPVLLERLRSQSGGPQNAEVRSGPFSIATIVNGQAAEDELAAEEDSPLHRALEGLCSGDRYWSQTKARPLQEHKLDDIKGPDKHLVLATRRGRAVWFPLAFQSSGERRSLLGCYHRNLSMLSLQVESLLALLTLAHNDFKTLHQVRSGPLEDLAKRGAQILGHLYGRGQSYRSASAPAQIEAEGRKAIADDVRKRLGVGGSLFRGSPPA